jgi:hypothetical protein
MLSLGKFTQPLNNQNMLTNDLATYLINQKSAIIKPDGRIDWAEDELAMKRWSVQSWKA